MKFKKFYLIWTEYWFIRMNSIIAHGRKWPMHIVFFSIKILNLIEFLLYELIFWYIFYFLANTILR